VISIEEAVRRILDGTEPTEVERAALRAALGRTLAEDLVAAEDLPRWDNSAMDGYAVRSADLGEGDTLLDVVGVIAAGGWPGTSVGPGQAMAIMTGAPLPVGADAIVPVERSDGRQAGAVRLTGGACAGDHVRQRGEDVARGSRVLLAGQRLTPGRLGVAASLGCTDLPVRRRPRVAVLATGDEVAPPGTPLRPGQLWSSNQVALCAAIEEAGGEAIDAGIVRDELDETVAAIRAAAAGADALLTTGGVSVGAWDVVKAAFERLGASLDFWRVDIKPGKPLAVGRLGDARWFGLPGNPVSALVGFAVFVRPWIRVRLGDTSPHLARLHAVLDAPLRDAPGRVKLIRVALRVERGVIYARPTGTQSSGAATSMARAHGLAVVPGPIADVAAGETVPVLLLDASGLAGDGAG
jgi:molybdopterin molybdotransferase